MEESYIATDFEPDEYVIFIQSTKMGTHESKQQYHYIAEI